MKVLTREDLERLQELKQHMLEELDEIGVLLRDTREESRAKSYWMAHIETALEKTGKYLGGSFITMEETLEALEEEIVSESGEESEEDEGLGEEIDRVASEEIDEEECAEHAVTGK